MEVAVGVGEGLALHGPHEIFGAHQIQGRDARIASTGGTTGRVPRLGRTPSSARVLSISAEDEPHSHILLCLVSQRRFE